MAYQTRGRDPLFDSTMAAAIFRRVAELLGLALLACGVVATLALATYHPDDPSWLSASGGEVRNLLGEAGALVAALALMIIGWAALGAGAAACVWGGRFILHQGEDRAAGRVIFLPIWLAALSIWASSLPARGEWAAAHGFGMGGMFGDMVNGAVLSILPHSAAAAVDFLPLAFGVAAAALGAYVLGFSRSEGMRLLRLALMALVLVYAVVMYLLGRGAAAAASRFRAQAADRYWSEDEPAPAPPPAAMAEPEPDPAPAEDFAMAEAPPTSRPRWRARAGGVLTLLGRGAPAPEPESPAAEAVLRDDGGVGDERIRAKIRDAVRSRQGVAAEPAPIPAQEPEGPSAAAGAVELPDEPPLTAAMLDGAPPSPVQASPAPQGDDGLHAEPKSVVRLPTRKAAKPSSRAMREAQPALEFEERGAEFELPPLGLLAAAKGVQKPQLSSEALEQNARMLENVLEDYGVKGDIVEVRPGPVVTMYELEPAPGIKSSRVIGLADDIARSMSALSARVSTLPGRNVIGIELPNDNRETVFLREILEQRDFGDCNHTLPLALGKDIGGAPVVANLARMPHLLIAGTTGSGKSVAINTMILSLLYKLTPKECQMIMIDPKMLELSVYDGIPHLLSPVVTDPKKAVVALKWVVAEMDERYRKMSKMSVRNIDGYNARVEDALKKGETFSRTVQTGFDEETGEPVFETEELAPEKMPFIVVIVDEMADLMMVAGKDIEACIQRLAQMARASGIHLIMATQRPSVDVITGTIKANFPTRISFQVTSKVDSRTILGEMGAEQLLGMGDMLYMAGGNRIMRCHGPFVSDEEVEEVVRHLKAFGPPEYVSGVQEGPEAEKAGEVDAVLGLAAAGEGEDALYDQAVHIVLTDRKCSTSYIQRKLSVGYNKAARLVEQMEEQGVVGAANHVGKREILVPEQQ